MKAIMPVLDDSRKKPYYLQLYDYIKEAILKGEIRENEKLPSLRSLSRSTGLSVTTVEQSYNQLLVEGYVYSKAQSGCSRCVFSSQPYTDAFRQRTAGTTGHCRKHFQPRRREPCFPL